MDQLTKRLFKLTCLNEECNWKENAILGSSMADIRCPKCKSTVGKSKLVECGDCGMLMDPWTPRDHKCLVKKRPSLDKEKPQRLSEEQVKIMEIMIKNFYRGIPLYSSEIERVWKDMRLYKP